MFVEVAAVAAWCVFVASGQRVPIYRLPKTVLPTQYKLFLETDPFGYTFSGKITIDVEIRAKTNNITLHSKGLNITNFGLEGQQGTKGMTASFHMDEINDLLLIQTSALLQPGDRYILNISFEGKLKIFNHPRPYGYFRVKTGRTEEKWMSSTAFQMISAREAFPCWDEPQFKARFLIILTHLTTYKALSNMPLVKSVPAGKEGWVVDHFENTPLMSTYLVTFHLLQFNSVEIKADDSRPLKLWTSQRNISSSLGHLDFARKTLTWLQNYTGIREPMPKIDLVEIEGFPGALENWGDISFGNEEKLQDANATTEERDVATIAHELAHSWFGNLVTPVWWDSLWLSEGGASFVSALAVDELVPKYSYLRKTTKTQQLTTFVFNLEVPQQPLNPSLQYVDELLVIPPNVYYHGFSLFNLLYHVLGTNKFKVGVRRYLSALQYNTTSPFQLYSAFDYQWEGRDLTELMSEWTYRGGFPVVTATRSKGQLTLAQEPFIVDHSTENETNEDNVDVLRLYKKPREDTQWWVPITFTTQSKKDFNDTRPKMWFKDTKTILDPADPEEWLLLNAEASGIYIVKYDKTNIEMILKSLNSSNYGGISEETREKLFLDYGLLNLREKFDINEMSRFDEMLSLERSTRLWKVALILYWQIIQKSYLIADGPLLLSRMCRIMKKRIDDKGDESIPLRNMIINFAYEYNLPECGGKSSKIQHL